MIQNNKNNKYIFNIDRGGTFTDFYVQQLKNNCVVAQYSFKISSQSNKGQGPIIGIKQFLLQHNGIKTSLIPINMISGINLGTTIVTNALLEKKGCKCGMILSQGFHDLLEIRHQARPNIFDLTNQTKPMICHSVYQIESRTYFNPPNNTYQAKQYNGRFLYNQQPSMDRIVSIFQSLQSQHIQSIGISLCNSYLNNQNQKIIQNKLLELGYNHNISIGSSYNQLGYLSRTQTICLNAYLNPIIHSYFNRLLQNFDYPQQLNLRIMQSQGGFISNCNIQASRMLLSGPVGGLIAYANMNQLFCNVSQQSICNSIGLDMGGTSTDLSRVYNGKVETVYTFECQGIQICTPHLAINTIAAGGGSQLGFTNGMFTVGPHSVGSNPGPVCYGIGNKLAITDANFILNRLDLNYFPKIFGQNNNQQLNIEMTKLAFIKLKLQIELKTNINKSIFEIAQGYIEIANQLMAKNARKLLTMGIPDALVIFGSAGGQHCCAIATKIGINNIFIHQYSGIFSAYGLSKAPQTKQYKYFIGKTISKQHFSLKWLLQQISNIRNNKQSQQNYDIIQEQIGIGYKGTTNNIFLPISQHILQQFQKKHQQQYGFKLITEIFRIEFLRVKYIQYPKQLQYKQQNYQIENSQKYKYKNQQVFLQGKFHSIPLYDLQKMKNCQVQGPAMLLSATSSILVQGNWKAKIKHRIVYISKKKKQQNAALAQNLKQCDPIKLTLYSTRLMSIAQQMGKTLQRIAISTNIRQRLDFSCGIFDTQGKLLANAPHLPVHLGSMQTAVTQQIKRGLQHHEVVLSNHPIAGGSHLPDLTVITPIAIESGLTMYVASRGHHADIGGITPGSMPPFSRHLNEEGIAIQKFNLVNKNGQFRFKQVRELFASSRRTQDNVSDLLAQMAANEIGCKLVMKFISQYGILQFQQYMNLIYQNACSSVQNMLYEFSILNNFKQIEQLQAEQFMDDGTKLKLKLIINRNLKNAIFDFNGTGLQIIGNTNTPKSITKSVILYCLRCLINQDIPLNSGCLKPIQIIIPNNCIISPSNQCAVVGGNVQTSQKLVDLILKPFQRVASSQGTMNNLLFGNDKISYYQTICGGSGAGQGFKGKTIQCHMTNTRITDVQYIEKQYPIIVTIFKKRVGSAGQGKFQGGQGAIRQIMFLQPMDVSVLSQRRLFQGYGLEGGKPGSKGRNTLISNGIRKNIGHKNSFKVQIYDRVRIQTPGGGGYGSQEITQQ